MLRTHSRPWMVACWTAGSCVCKWHVTVDQHHRIVALIVVVVVVAVADADVRVHLCEGDHDHRVVVAPIRHVHVPRAVVRRSDATSSHAVLCANR